MEKDERKLKDWIKENLDKHQIQDMGTYGIDAG